MLVKVGKWIMFKKIVIAYDHRVDLSYIEKIKQVLKENEIESFVVEDNETTNDYPILAQKCHNLYLEKEADGMILLCGTGIGMNVVANKFDGIRSVLATSEAEAYFSRRHEDANCLVFGAGYSDGEDCYVQALTTLPSNQQYDLTEYI